MSQLNVPINLESVKDDVSFREFLYLANQELENSLTRIRSSREESDQLLQQIEEVMAKLQGRA